MSEEDLPTILWWLRQPHVAQWWTADPNAEALVIKYRKRILDARSDHDADGYLPGRPIGWGQWYRWADYPAEAEAMQAFDGECGIDYAIGNDTDLGRGLGSDWWRRLSMRSAAASAMSGSWWHQTPTTLHPEGSWRGTAFSWYPSGRSQPNRAKHLWHCIGSHPDADAPFCIAF